MICHAKIYWNVHGNSRRVRLTIYYYVRLAPGPVYMNWGRESIAALGVGEWISEAGHGAKWGNDNFRGNGGSICALFLGHWEYDGDEVEDKEWTRILPVKNSTFRIM